MNRQLITIYQPSYGRPICASMYKYKIVDATTFYWNSSFRGNYLELLRKFKVALAVRFGGSNTIKTKLGFKNLVWSFFVGSGLLGIEKEITHRVQPREYRLPSYISTHCVKNFANVLDKQTLQFRHIFQSLLVPTARYFLTLLFNWFKKYKTLCPLLLSLFWKRMKTDL